MCSSLLLIPIHHSPGPYLAASPASHASWTRQLFPIALFIFIYYIYLLLFPDYHRSARQLQRLDEVGVCWVVGLTLRHSLPCPRWGLAESRAPGLGGGHGGDPEEDAFAAGHLHLSLPRQGRGSATARG